MYLPSDDTVPFTRSHALAMGADPRLIRGSRFKRVFGGVRVSADVALTPEVRARAALLLHPPTAFISSVTGAELLQLPVPPCDRTHVSVVKQEERRQRPGLACHVACTETVVTQVRGIRTSSPLDLFVELAGALSLVDLVVVGDAMVRRGLFTAEQLRHFCAGTTRWYARRARRGASYVRRGVDSPMESRLRMLLVLGGLPEPVVDHHVVDASGRARRLDLSYPALKRAVEYDGRQHAETGQWRSDLQRREDLEREGWRFTVVTSEGVYQDPGGTVMRVATALRGHGVRLRPLRDGWRPHFPVS